MNQLKFTVLVILVLALAIIPILQTPKCWEGTLKATEVCDRGSSHHESNKDATALWRIVVTSNSAFERELLNWWYHYRLTGMLRDGNVEVVLYAEDEYMYEKYKGSTKIAVKQAWKSNTRFQNVESGKFVIGEAGFNELVSRRPSLILEELSLGGPNVLYMDLDVILLQDPRPFFVGAYDLWAAMAENTAQKSANDWVLNSGFLVLRPTQANIDCLSEWNKKLQEPANAGTNQGPFNAVVSQMEREGRLRVKLLLDRLFPVGRKFKYAYQNQVTHNVSQAGISYPSLDGAVAFHNNFCSSYRDCKIDRFKALDLWVEIESTELL